MTPWVRVLLAANVAVYLMQITMPWLTRELAFVPIYILARPWTLFTYMFAHDTGGFGHIAFNMLSLYFFGPRVEMQMGSPRFIAMYIVAGMTGGILSLFFTPIVSIIGASGAIFGVMFAFARFWPRERIMIWGVFPVEARVLVIFTTLMSFLGGFSGGGGVAHFAHLGGYLGAWIYLRLAEWRSPSQMWKRKLEATAPPPVALGDWKRVDITKVHEANRDEVNRILAKINSSGLGSLTTQERTFLQHFVPKEGT